MQYAAPEDKLPDAAAIGRPFMRIVYIGTGDIGLPALRSLMEIHEVVGVVTQPDKPVGRKQELHASAIKLLALERGVPVLQPWKIKEPGALEEIQRLEAEVIVVMAYGQILPKALLELPPKGCINLHASLLPRHRGAAPIQAAIDAGESQTGITSMYMDVGLDTGDLLLQKTLPIRRRETGGSLHDRLALLAPSAVLESLELLAKGMAPREPQDSRLATYAPKLEREHGVLDWNQNALVLERRIRALNPWPSAYTTLQGRKLKVFSAIVCRKIAGQPGVVARADSRGILVGTSEGSLLLRDIQMEGKKRMSAGDFLLGHRLSEGLILGSPTPLNTAP